MSHNTCPVLRASTCHPPLPLGQGTPAAGLLEWATSWSQGSKGLCCRLLKQATTSPKVGLKSNKNHTCAPARTFPPGEKKTPNQWPKPTAHHRLHPTSLGVLTPEAFSVIWIFRVSATLLALLQDLQAAFGPLPGRGRVDGWIGF